MSEIYTYEEWEEYDFFDGEDYRHVPLTAEEIKGMVQNAIDNCVLRCLYAETNKERVELQDQITYFNQELKRTLLSYNN